MAASTTPMLYGAAYNVYVRAVRLALAEKNVPYQMIEVDLASHATASTYSVEAIAERAHRRSVCWSATVRGARREGSE